jgi:ribonuclease R
MTTEEPICHKILSRNAKLKVRESNPEPGIYPRTFNKTEKASRDELAIELNIEGEEQTEALRRRLRAMERDGQLVFTRRQCYALPERLDLLKGTVIGHRDGYGFLRVEGRKDDLYLSSEQMKTCIHGDQVLAQPLGADRKGRREARIVRVLVPKTSQIVGRYFTDAGVGFRGPGRQPPELRYPDPAGRDDGRADGLCGGGRADPAPNPPHQSGR